MNNREIGALMGLDYSTRECEPPTLLTRMKDDGNCAGITPRSSGGCQR